MQLTIVTLSDQYFNVDVSDDLELENFKVLCEMETGVPVVEMSVVWDGRPLHNDKLTLKQYGIKNGEIVLVQHLHGQIRMGERFQGLSTLSQMQHENDPAFIRDLFLKNPTHLALLKTMNPPLAAALLSGDMETFSKVYNDQRQAKMKQEEENNGLMTADPFDPKTQHQIENAIRLRNIESNMQTAIELTPESFGQISMLYIDCKVNGHPVKAFVDSGAQMTIMSQTCAERCQIMRLVDMRWAGVAKGVGTQAILGRVHLCQIQIGNAFLQSSFSILENQPMDMLLGLDMLRRHQCVIDLKKNQLEIGTTGTAAPFLAEVDLPEHARLIHSSDLATCDSDKELAEALTRSAQEANKKGCTSKPSTSKSPQSSSAKPQISENGIIRLMSHGFSRNAAVEELRCSNGNVDKALATLLSKSFSLP